MSFDPEMIPNNMDGGGEHNVCDLFFIPCLSACKSYRRTAAEITEGAIANWGKAMLNIINNDVPIEFAIGNNSEDFPLVKKLDDLIEYPEKRKEAEKKFHDYKMNFLFRDLKKNTNLQEVIRGLYASGQMKIQCVFHLNEEKKIRLHHQKVGYFEIPDKKSIVFSGGGNESRNAYLENGENLSVRKENHEHHKEDYEFYKNLLDKVWEKKHPNKIVIEPDKDFVDQIKRNTTAKSKNDLRKSWEKYLETLQTNPPSSTQVPVPAKKEEIPKKWEHQIKALNTYLHSEKNDYSIDKALDERDTKKCKGILSMATGTGKTSTSLRIAKELINDKKISKILIVPPNKKLLCAQWYDSVKKWRKDNNLDNFKILRHFHDHKEVEEFKREKEHILIAKRDFDLLGYILKNIDKEKTFIVHDEVHGFGAPKLQGLEGIQKQFKYTLGLSATPEREYSEEETEYIFSEIGKPIFDYPLEKAIANGTLCPFKYHEIKVMQSKETGQKIASAIRSHAAKKKNNPNVSSKELANSIALYRATDENKIPSFRYWANSDDGHLIKNSIIFCATMEQGEQISRILNERGLKFTKNYAEDPKEQQASLDELGREEIDTIINCHSLSEGIDIRSLENVILLSSYKAKLETIQRVGRCLRVDDENNPDKVANVIDVVLYKNIEKNETIDTEKNRKEWLSGISKDN
tara:strand:- start:1530 stop:3596 length:2067 start_codon:yes stop_codon:yes gene_type:complete